jgi:hypothetical protein
MERGMIEDYMKERDIEAYIDDLWNRTAMKLKSKGVWPVMINKAIKASRRNNENNLR